MAARPNKGHPGSGLSVHRANIYRKVWALLGANFIPCLVALRGFLILKRHLQLIEKRKEEQLQHTATVTTTDTPVLRNQLNSGELQPTATLATADTPSKHREATENILQT